MEPFSLTISHFCYMFDRTVFIMEGKHKGTGVGVEVEGSLPLCSYRVCCGAGWRDKTFFQEVIVR